MSATLFGWIGEWENAMPYSGSRYQSRLMLFGMTPRSRPVNEVDVHWES